MPFALRQNSLTGLIKAIVLTTLIVSLLGFIDYITGEVSIDILYILCICAVTWYTNLVLGALCVIEIISAKVTADYYCNIKVGTHLYEWKAMNFFFICIVVCVLSGSVKRLLSK